MKRIIRENSRKNVGKTLQKEKYFQKKEISENSASLSISSKQSYVNSFPFNGNSVETGNMSNNVLSDCTSSSAANVENTDLCDNSESIEIFKYHLRHWAIGHHIALTAVSDLLKILKLHLKLHSLPSDARTILKTEDVKNEISNLFPGKYYHFGLKSKLLLKLIQNNFKGYEVNISINIDGLPLTKSSGSQFWLILIKIDELKQLRPFPIAIYHGENKPKNSNNFLQKFTEEMKSLQEEGVFLNNQIIKINVSKILCDAPAKAFVLCIKNFNSYQSCTKCWAEGLFINNRMTFPELHSKLRTDEEFSN